MAQRGGYVDNGQAVTNSASSSYHNSNANAMRPIPYSSRCGSCRETAQEIVLGKRRIAPDTALSLERPFGMSPQFWLGLQMDDGLDAAEDEVGEQIEREVHVLATQ